MHRRRSYLLLALSVALCIGAVALAAWLSADRTHDDKRLLLEWLDPDQKVIFRVTDQPGPIVKQNTRLHVGRDGREESVLIDDDAVFSTIALVRYDHWLLVVCRGRDEVWAGYDYDSRKLYGERHWSSLPFTLWTGQGPVVAERTLGGKSYSPADFPRQ